MPELLAGGVVITVTLILHVLGWRSGRVDRTVGNLVRLFGAGLGICALLLLAGALPPLPSVAGVLRTLLLAVTVFLVYLSFYSAVELDSTSAVVLLTVERGPAEGVPEGELFGLLDDADLIVARAEEMVRSRWLVRDGQTYRLAPRGRVFLGAVRLVRRTFKADRVGG